MAQGGVSDTDHQLLQRLRIGRSLTAGYMEIQDLLSELEELQPPVEGRRSNKGQYRQIRDKFNCYRMEHSPRGRALVVTMTGDRQGWQEDVRALHKMFLFLDVQPIYHFDSKSMDMLEQLKKFASSEENVYTDCLFVVLMGHGGRIRTDGENKNKEYIQTPDGYALVLRDTFEYIFSGRKCQHLVDKPKIFLVQTCRGGMEIEETEIFNLHGTTESDAASIIRRVAPFCDYVIGFPTQPGIKSYRDSMIGSWYIHEVCHVFREQAASRHVEDMLKEVNRRLEILSATKDEPQIGEYMSCLKAPLFLFPGLYQACENKLAKVKKKKSRKKSKQLDMQEPNPKLPACVTRGYVDRVL